MPVATKRDATSLRSVPRSASVQTPYSVQDPEPDTHDEPDSGRSTDVQSPASSTEGNATTAHYAAMSQLANFMAPMRPAGALGTREEIQAELDGIAMAVRAFPLKQPDQILRETSAYTARLTELTVLLHRSEEYDRQYTRVRTMQVQKWVEELERQWKTASRLIEVQRQDLALMGGQP